MVFAGLVVTMAGFLLSVASLGMTSSNSIRLIVTLVGLGVSIFGILGIVNRAYLKDAIWKKRA